MRPFAIPMVRSAFFAAVAALSVLLPTDVGARGESCDINLPNGLKEPGKEDGNRLLQRLQLLEVHEANQGKATQAGTCPRRIHQRLKESRLRTVKAAISTFQTV